MDIISVFPKDRRRSIPYGAKGSQRKYCLYNKSDKDDRFKSGALWKTGFAMGEAPSILAASIDCAGYGESGRIQHDKDIGAALPNINQDYKRNSANG
jgi:hypothetical protein